MDGGTNEDGGLTIERGCGSDADGSAQLSRKHAVIYYDFEKKGWYVKVLSKNGIMVHNKLRGADDIVELKPITFMDFVGEWLEFYLPEEDSLIPFPPED